MALYEMQKETAGTWATIVWIGSGLILYLTTEGASLWSWSALVFFVVGMFAAAIVFGVAIYGLQRGLSKALLKVAKVPTPGVVTAIRSIGWVLFVVETVVIYLAASWVFHEILEPARAELPTELSDERILSKDDARVMFSMSKGQWLANVQQAVTTGVANAMGTPETAASRVAVPEVTRAASAVASKSRVAMDAGQIRSWRSLARSRAISETAPGAGEKAARMPLLSSRAPASIIAAECLCTSPGREPGSMATSWSEAPIPSCPLVREAAWAGGSSIIG